MVGHLIICFVDTERISHNQEIVNEIIGVADLADVIQSEFTFLFKDEDFASEFLGFENNVVNFLNDPLGLYWYDETEEEFDSFSSIMEEQQSFDSEEVVFEYRSDYIPVFIQFVSSESLFISFCEFAVDVESTNCQEFYPTAYNISCLDQMEILRRLQVPETDSNIVRKITTSSGERRKNLFNKLYKRREN